MIFTRAKLGFIIQILKKNIFNLAWTVSCLGYWAVAGDLIAGQALGALQVDRRVNR